MDKITFTLKQVRANSSYGEDQTKLYKLLGGAEVYWENTPITITQIIDSNGLEDALTILRVTPNRTHNLWRHFAVDCASMVSYSMTGESSLKALKVARSFADGKPTEDELAKAFFGALNDIAVDVMTASFAIDNDDEDGEQNPAWIAHYAAKATLLPNGAWAARNAALSAAMAARAVWETKKDAAEDAQAWLLKKYCKLGKRPKDSEAILKSYYEELLKKYSEEDKTN